MPIINESGIISWFIDGNALPPYDILVEVRLNGQVILTVTRSLGQRGADLITRGGGEAHGFNRHVKVNFPAGSLPEDADVKVRAPENTELTLGGRPMELTATGRESGMEITQFSQPVTITLEYSDEDAARQLEHAGMKDESSLTLFYYNESKGTWYPLTTSVDSAANRLTAITDHFSLLDYKAQNWEAARLPSLEGFQLSTFTGAGSYSYPIQVPPGPGGLQPSLELSYNTQEVDSSSSRTQASWVGMGWSLDTGYIQRNMNGTPNYFGDDTFSLVMNGVGGLLLPVADQDGDGDCTNNGCTIDYHLANENYWQVRQYLASGDVGGYNGDRSQWVVFAPDGTKFYFGNYANGSLDGHAWYQGYPSGCTVYRQTWRWSLTRTVNIFGKEITYTYNYDSLPRYGNGCQGTQGYMAMAAYPEMIIYPNNRYRIKFTRDLNPDGSGKRTDFDQAWIGNPAATTLFMQSNLKQIEVWHDPNGTWDSGDEVLIRKYVLGYGEDGQQIFPGVTWPGWTGNDGKTLSLTSITEYGLNGTNSLPATTFKYWPMHFKSMENGYGGKLSFGYDNWHADNGDESYLFDPDGVLYGTGEFYPDDFNDNELDLLKQYYQPGTYYQIVTQVWPTAGYSWIQSGLDDGVTRAYGDQYNLTWGVWNTITSTVVISAEASQARALFKCNGGCELGKYEVFPLVTRYRVTTKTITDEVTDDPPYSITYEYEGAAVNDADHSDYVENDPEGDFLMTKPNTEFRGHSHVTETDLDGRKVEIWYYQDDIYKGRASQTQITDYDGNIYTESDITYDSQENPTYNLPHPEGQPANSDLEIWWVYTTIEENRTYNGNSSYVATKNEYQYLTSDQGNAQYGNRTKTISYWWNGYDWGTYRGTLTKYFPKVSNDTPNTPENSRYLTGLRAYYNAYDCNGSCDFNDPLTLISAHKWLYDYSGDANAQPANGVLTGERNLIFYATPPRTNAQFADTEYDYDAWGNQDSLTVYTDATDSSNFGEGTEAQITTSCYGSGTAPTCSEDNYGTYMAWQKNDLGHVTKFTYDKTKSVPTRLTDPNEAFTDATYDEFGRILTIVRMGDSTNYPTAVMSYHEPSGDFTNNPFWTEAQQRITGSTYFKIRKYYNGIGQLLQTQVVGAVIGIYSRDIRSDTYYDVAGRVYRQSVPYDVQTSYYYQEGDPEVAYTETTYDILGRTLIITAPDGATTSYSYTDGYISDVPYLSTTVTNAREYDTTTQSDMWGRVVKVTPATGPTVSYTYDAADRLLETQRGGSTTTLTYDFGGRKESMTDPDMGGWSYTYDALGSLKTQTDARGCITTLDYDSINRLTGKSYSGSCCGTAVTYSYDAGTYGKGHRTGMNDGSGSTSWTYDNRGRVTQEIKVIGDTESFKTLWGYNSADMVSSMTYPASNNGTTGEVVTFSYLRQMLLDTVIGTNTYVLNSNYEAAGRITERELGSNGGTPIIQTSYTYFDWKTINGVGRLQNMLSEQGANTLQDLSYTYDAVGNVKTITDLWAVFPNPQYQSFYYDELDRLTSARAYNTSPDGYSGGGGVASDDGTYALQNYTYDASTGNVSSMGGAGYTYPNPNTSIPAHGVQRISGGNSTIGTITVRAKGTSYGGVWPVMILYVNGVKIKQWTVNSSSFANYTKTGVSLSANDQIEIVYTNDQNTTRALYVDYVMINGRTVHSENGAAVIDKGSGSAAFDWLNVIPGQQSMTENGALRLVVGERAFAGAYDENGNMEIRIVDGEVYSMTYDAENRLVGVNWGVTATFTYDGDGNRVKGEITGGDTTTYIGNYVEWIEGADYPLVKYYYAGNTRVAMRSDSLKFLLGDHLGSTAITTNSSGGFNSEIRYYPWGGVRYTSGSSPTTYQFTGQRIERDLGLYFYNARWYDPQLGRFIQADTIVPGGVQGLDRYAYVGNNPLRYTDPSGHQICDPDGYCGNYVSIDAQLWQYKLQLGDDWTDVEKIYILLAASAIGNKMSDVIGGSSAYAFGTVFGGTKFIRDPSLGVYGGKWTGEAVLLNPSLMNQFVVTHELGHVFQSLVYTKNYAMSPANMLAATTLFNDLHEPITGLDNGNFNRTDQGYKSCSPSNACRYEEHPRYKADGSEMDDGNSAYEDTADMFLNWVYNSFDYSVAAGGAGSERYEWMNSNMSLWVNYTQP